MIQLFRLPAGLPLRFDFFRVVLCARNHDMLLPLFKTREKTNNSNSTYLDIPRTNAAVAAEPRQFANAAVAATLRVRQTARSALRSGTRIGSTLYSKDR